MHFVSSTSRAKTYEGRPCPDEETKCDRGIEDLEGSLLRHAPQSDDDGSVMGNGDRSSLNDTRSHDDGINVTPSTFDIKNDTNGNADLDSIGNDAARNCAIGNTNPRIKPDDDNFDWLDEDSDLEEVPSSEFEGRFYDLGFRESLRLDYPESEENGRRTGFRDAFSAFCSQINKTETLDDRNSKMVNQTCQDEIIDHIDMSLMVNQTCRDEIVNEIDNRSLKNEFVDRKADEIEELSRNMVSSTLRSSVSVVHKENCRTSTTAAPEETENPDHHAKPYHPTRALSALDGNLSHLLLRYRLKMTEEQLREILSIRDSIKKEMEAISNSHEKYVEVSQLQPKLTCCSVAGTSVSGSKSCPVNSFCVSRCCTVAKVTLEKSPIQFNEHTSVVVNDLYDRTRTLSLAFDNWTFPSLYRCDE